MQCDKRNTYRRKVKEDKAASAPKDGEEGDTTIEDETIEGANGAATNGHANGENADRPTKKLKGDDGAAVAPDVDMEDDEDPGDGQEDDQDDPDDGDDVQDDEDEEQSEGDEQDASLDETDGPHTTAADLMPVDEALDDPGSDSD